MSELSEFNTDIRVVNNNVELSFTHMLSEIVVSKPILYETTARARARAKCDILKLYYKDKPLELIMRIVAC